MSQLQLQIKDYQSIGEKVYHTVLPSGLKIFLLPKSDFNETYAVLTSKMGSIDIRFQAPDKQVEKNYPPGLAHFLEHKLFESTDQEDILVKFTKHAAEGNAFTSFTKTSYLFSATSYIEENLDLLFSLVSQANFTNDSIAHEKNIISQEIEMYQDSSDYRLFFSTLANLYPETGLAYDIAGSLESVKEISKDDLIDAYDKFYDASNLELFIVGNFLLEDVVKKLEELDSKLKTGNKVSKERKKLDLNPVVTLGSQRMEVSTPKLAIAMRGRDTVSDRERFRYKILLRLLFSMMFGWTSKRFQSLYESGKIDHSLSLEVEVEDGFHFVMLTLDAEEPLTLSHQIRSAIKQFATDPDVTEEHLDTIKSEMFGDFLHGLNSMQYMANNFESHTSGENLFDLPKLLQSIHLADVLEVGHRFIDHCDVIDYTILPK